MPRTFQLPERIVGIVLTPAKQGEEVQVCSREALTSLDGAVLEWRLEELHSVLLSRVPDLPPPSQIDHLLLAQVRVGRPVNAGEPIYSKDILDLTSYDLGVTVPPGSAVVVVRSHGWRRALFYDFTPLLPEAPERQYDLSAVLARQTLALLTGQFGVKPPSAALHRAIDELEALLGDRCADEARYQELLQRYPWLLGGQHTAIDRHTNLDDRNIPDFTGVRARDAARDVFEIKEPFLKCFLKNGGFSAAFNSAWEQAERYLTFTRNNKNYLQEEKGLMFSNPHCFPLIGSGLSDAERRRFHEREAHNPSISLLTYEQVISLARALLSLVERAS